MTAPRVARVILESPLPQLSRPFDYLIPQSLRDQACPGVRVRVPLRSMKRLLDGFIVELADAETSDRPLSEIESVISPVPVLTPQLYALASRAAARAAGSVSDILRLVIPRRMVRAEKAWLSGAVSAPVIPAESARWAAATLDEYPQLRTALSERTRCAVTAAARVDSTPGGETVLAWAELFAAAALDAGASGTSTVIVVPDYRDQVQVLCALAHRVDASAIVRVDARQTASERYAGYLRMLSPTPCIVVGNRSAVYAPAHRVSLVAIWDDGDPLLAEPLSPGVHARDVALLRAADEGCALLMAGHTRTTDVERLVGRGWMRSFAPHRPVHPRTILSMPRDEEVTTRIPSAVFAAARDAAHAGPVLIQVARPGYAPTLVCADCRRAARCTHCSGPLMARRHGATPECSWCGRAGRQWACRVCSATRVRMSSAGSERTAAELGKGFPGVRVVVSDGDHDVQFVDDKPAVVVATRGAEPLAVGGYHAVVLLDGERMLQAESLRIGESSLRWWSNAAALAAPGAPVHLVGVSGPVARAFATWNQAGYARAELRDRADLLLPPAVRIASVEGSAQAVTAALEAVQAAANIPPPLGPVPTEAGVRAVLRFGYVQGEAVTTALRTAVVSDALRGRRPARPGSAARGTLRVRLDLPDVEL